MEEPAGAQSGSGDVCVDGRHDVGLTATGYAILIIDNAINDPLLVIRKPLNNNHSITNDKRNERNDYHDRWTNIQH